MYKHLSQTKYCTGIIYMLFNFIFMRRVFICLNLNTVTKGKQLTVGDAKDNVCSLRVSNLIEMDTYIPAHIHTHPLKD